MFCVVPRHSILLWDNYQVQGLYSYLKTNQQIMIVFPSSLACVTRRVMSAIIITLHLLLSRSFLHVNLLPPNLCGPFEPNLSWIFIRWCVAKFKLLVLIVNSTWMLGHPFPLRYEHILSFFIFMCVREYFN